MFDNLKKLETQATSWMDLPEVAPGARLMLKMAGESNSGYFNALLRLASRRARARGDSLVAQHLDQLRADDRELYPMHVMAGWEGIVDDQGQPVAFSRQVAAEFAQKLPDWLFDRVRRHAAAPENFLPPGEDMMASPEVIAGN